MLNRSKKAICVVLASLCCLSLMSCKKSATESNPTAATESSSSVPKTLAECRLTYDEYAVAMTVMMPELQGWTWANEGNETNKIYTESGNLLAMQNNGKYYEISHEDNGHYSLYLGSYNARPMRFSYGQSENGEYYVSIPLERDEDEVVKEVWPYALAALGDYSPQLDAGTFLEGYHASVDDTDSGDDKSYETTVGGVTYSCDGWKIKLTFNA